MYGRYLWFLPNKILKTMKWVEIKERGRKNISNPKWIIYVW